MSPTGPKWLMLSWIEATQQTKFREWSRCVGRPTETMRKTFETGPISSVLSHPRERKAGSISNLREQPLNLILGIGSER